MKFTTRLYQTIDYLRFKLRHPSIPIVKSHEFGNFFSQDGQDIYLASLLFGKLHLQGGVVVDIGCNHPTRYSNSFLLEKNFSCKTIGIDALDDYKDSWTSLRPNAEFIHSAISTHEGSVDLMVPDDKNNGVDDMFSSIVSLEPKAGDVSYSTRTVPSTTLNKICADRGIDEILLISIDVEGAELGVLQSINFSKVRVTCLIVENNTRSVFGSEEIRDYLSNSGFYFYSRLGKFDDVFLNKMMLRTFSPC